jgi:hypothetical protein
MRGAAQGRWEETWRVVARPGAVRVRLAPRGDGRASLGALPAGTPVVLEAAGPAALLRCRRAAARAGVALEREYLAFPSAGAPAYLVEAAAGPVSLFLRDVLVAPPRAVAAAALSGSVAIVRALRPRRALHALAPGAIVVGRRV